MSTTIDQRVVEMEFDNRRFESNIGTTIASLNKLGDSLNFTGATKGLEDIDAASSKCDFSILSSAVSKVSSGFSSLEVMAITALSNITNSAVNAGKRIVSALTIDPIKTGFSEYETQINAVQTILANTESKGKTLDDVNTALDELNTYADKTIYNFTEMTRNIGTFTAAGVDLDTSVSAIKGIANLAAVSGSTSQQASTAMYQLSQALASGTVKLMDWNSVVNAGMGGQVFQDALKETARVHGVAIDDMITKNGSFRETLQEGWLTSEILTETLSKFTGDLTEDQLKSMGYTEEQIEGILKMGKTANDAATKVKTFTQLFDTLKEAAQSGWSQTWEILVGDFEEAKELFTEVSDTIGAMIGKSAESRNELLEDWKVLGGRADLIESIRNVFHGIMSVVKPLKEAFTDIFPPITANQLVKFTKGLRDLTSKLVLSEETSEKLARTFRGVFAIIDLGRHIFVTITKAVFSLFGGVTDLSGSILDITAAIGDWTANLVDNIKSSEFFSKSIQEIVTMTKSALGFLKKFTDFLADNIVPPSLDLLGSIFSRILDRLKGLATAAAWVQNKLTKAFTAAGNSLENSSLFSFISAGWKIVKNLGTALSGLFNKFLVGSMDKLSKINFSGIVDIFNEIVKGGIGVAIIGFIKGLGESTENLSETIGSFKDFVTNFKGIFDDVRGCLEAYQENLKAEVLMKIAKSIALLAVSILIISLIDSDKLAASLGAVTVLFGELMASLALFTKISGKTTNVVKAVTAMTAIANAVLILASALKIVSTIDWPDLISGLVGVAALMAMVVAATKLLSKGGPNIVIGATNMVIYAMAIKILASVCKDLSTLSFGGLVKGLAGVATLLTAVAVFTRTAKLGASAMTTAAGVVILAAGLKLMASVCEDFASMSSHDIVKGLGAIAVLLADIAIFSRLTSNGTKILLTGVGLIGLAAGMKILAEACKEFATMSLWGIVKSMLAISLALSAVRTAVKRMPKDIAITGVGVLIVAGALAILADSLVDIASLSFGSILKGLMGIAGVLTAVTLAIKALPSNMLVAGAGLIVVADALYLLTGALATMGTMSWEGIAKGMVTLAGSLALLAAGLFAMNYTIVGSAALLIAAAALAILTPVLMTMSMLDWSAIALGMLKMAGAIVVLGAVAALTSAFATPLIVMSVAIGAIGLGALAAGAGLLLFATAMTALSTSVVVAAASIVSFITALIEGFIGLIPTVCTLIKELIIAICEIIVEASPHIGAAILALTLEVIKLLDATIPPLMKVIALLLDKVIELLIEYVPKIVDAALQITLGVLEGIRKHIDDIVVVSLEIIAKFIEGIGKGLPKVIQAGVNLVIDFINGMADSIRKNTPRMIAAVDNLMDAVMDAIAQWFTHSMTSGIKLTEKLRSGIEKGISKVVQAGKDAASGFIKGIKEKFAAVGEAAKGLGKKALEALRKVLRINSPSKETIKFGKGTDEGLIIGFKRLSGKVASTAGDVGGSALKSMSSALSGISDIINSDADMRPVISPVMDLSDVRSGVGTLNGMLAFGSSVGVSAHLGAISSSMSRHNQNGASEEVVSAINKLRKDIGNMGTTYQINGVTYDDGSNIADAVKSIVRAARIERRV